MKDLSIPAMIFVLILVFLVILYYTGASKDFSAFSGGVLSETTALQGLSGGKAVAYPK